MTEHSPKQCVADAALKIQHLDKLISATHLLLAESSRDIGPMEPRTLLHAINMLTYQNAQQTLVQHCMEHELDALHARVLGLEETQRELVTKAVNDYFEVKLED